MNSKSKRDRRESCIPMLSIGFLYSSYYKDSKKKMDSELKVQDQRWQQRRVDSLLTQNNNLFETENLPKIDT